VEPVARVERMMVYEQPLSRQGFHSEFSSPPARSVAGRLWRAFDLALSGGALLATISASGWELRSEAWIFYAVVLLRLALGSSDARVEPDERRPVGGGTWLFATGGLAIPVSCSSGAAAHERGGTRPAAERRYAHFLGDAGARQGSGRRRPRAPADGANKP